MKAIVQDQYGPPMHSSSEVGNLVSVKESN